MNTAQILKQVFEILDKGFEQLYDTELEAIACGIGVDESIVDEDGGEEHRKKVFTLIKSKITEIIDGNKVKSDDEEKPKAKAKKHNDEDEEKPKKPKAKAKKDEDDEKAKPKKAKAKVKKDEDDEDEEKPKAKSKKDEGDEKAKPKKAKAKAKKDEDDDDEIPKVVNCKCHKMPINACPNATKISSPSMAWTEEHYKKLSVPDLKAYAKESGAKTTGSKSVLIENILSKPWNRYKWCKMAKAKSEGDDVTIEQLQEQWDEMESDEKDEWADWEPADEGDDEGDDDGDDDGDDE